MDSPGELDAWFKSSLKNLVNNEISSVFTPLRPYEDFAANVGDRLQQETNISPVECVHRNGLHYFLTFTVEYEGKAKLANKRFVDVMEQLISMLIFLRCNSFFLRNLW